jgi:hypothetical protein
MGFRRSSADPCLYVKDSKNRLVIWISWVDDCLLMGHKKEVRKYHAVMNSYFDCDNFGDLKEYVGCKIDKQERGNCLLITQPEIVGSFIDEFKIQKDKKSKYQPQEAIHSVQFWTEMISTRKIKRGINLASASCCTCQDGLAPTFS